MTFPTEERKYIISEICGDWALHIKGSGTSNNFLFFKSRNNAELVKSILEWEDAHPNEAVPYKPTLTPPNEWVSVEERLPEDEARQYIEDDLDGIGYLYPCLLTYKSPNTERIHVVRFYYDIIQKWFVNNGEELCEKGRCIAWMPLPAPYDRRPPEGET